MRKYKVESKRSYEFTVCVGSTALNEDFLKYFRKYFCDFETAEDHIEHIIGIAMEYGNAYNLEGYHNILHDGYDKDFNKIPEGKLHKYINIIGGPVYKETDIKEVGRMK